MKEPEKPAEAEVPAEGAEGAEGEQQKVTETAAAEG